MRKVITGALILVFVILIAGLTYLTADFTDTQMKLSDSGKKNQTNPKYHFVMVVQSLDDPFWQELKQGVDKACKDFNVAVEFNGPEFTNIEEETKDLNIAIASRVDGIATNVLSEKDFTPLINKATLLGIPVVTVGSDARSSQRVSFIGSNSYNLGTEAGKLVISSSNGKSDVAFILSNYYSSEESVPQNVMLSGFVDSVRNYRNINVKTIQTATTGQFSAEEIARNIVNNYPTVSTIICTNSNDTMGVAQVMVDLYKVGKVKIIGYGDSLDVLRYVQSGVIYGSIIEDPVKIGYESVKMLFEAKEKGRPSSFYIDTEVKSVTQANLKQNYGDILDGKEQKKQ
ncbi:MAG: substrate-binding domain-containing protein [Bacillota bacterium]|nr:substrate-binding domain-containing protein [Bacillota bacterium]